MKDKKSIIQIVVLTVAFIVLINPTLNPFLSDGVKNAVSAELQNNFGILVGGAPTGIFSPAKLISAAAVAAFVALCTILLCVVLEKTTAGKRRSQTVAGLLTSLIKANGAVVGIVWVLSVVGVDLAAIFASLGIVSLVLGFGVQSLIEDCVTGIFIILEGVYNVGDIIILDDFRGTVKKITMRTTTIADAGGNLKVVNNSDIRNVQNRSETNSYAICDIGIGYDANLLEVEEIIKAALPTIYENNKDIFVKEPTYSGIAALGPSSVNIRVVAEVQEKDIFGAQRRLTREMYLLFAEKGIEIPFDQVVVHNAK